MRHWDKILKKIIISSPHILIVYFLILFFVSNVHADNLTIAAANSTCSAVKSAGALFQQQRDISIHYICKSSGRLAKGIKGRTIQADIYISANKAWMDKMVKNSIIARKDVMSMWGNSLLVVARKDDPIQLDHWAEMTSDKVKNIMIGDPGTAPFGRYAKQSFQSTGIWDEIKKKIETKKHITLLADVLVKSDYGTVGVLFKTNTNSEMKVIYAIDNSWHDPIHYFAAPVLESEKQIESQYFMDFMKSPEGLRLFNDAGFKTFNP